MNSYVSIGLFKNLDSEETIRFKDAADEAFDNADELLIKAIFHPVYRKRIGELLIEQADEELALMGE